MKQYKVTFYLINGEIGHLLEESSLIRARNKIKNLFEDGGESPLLALSENLVLVKSNVQYFTVMENEGA
ncbi:hypothetical protein HHO41_19360 [Bacillus sp. DNRA2]|uniref:hypothetical protein n=1 Tax=Bacillus sp. DNRA2 TaxID=2723053 RepID=UPI00145DCF12|nr:hypothetical protein [Bacillus sp. DNRA2]NMD72432.1 hypothetical protein [Bacillus sp. DNRA2]